MRDQLAALLSKFDKVPPRVLFGADPPAEFRRLSLLCHPDKFMGEAKKAQATSVFARLTELYAELNGHTVSKPVKLGNWVVVGPIGKGDICDVYRVDGKQAGILKIARSESDNDLLDREASSLEKLSKTKLDAKYHKYFPALLDKFEAGGRRVNVVSEVHGLPLSQLTLVADTKDFRHWVWMFNRLMTAIWVAHENGLIHGAIHPDHLIYIPEDHGLTLVDWTASSELGDKCIVPYISKDWTDTYPPEVYRKMAGEPTDIYMAAQCLFRYTADIDIPERFNPILSYCLAKSPVSRAQNAAEVQKLWKEAAKEVYGPPKFLAMKVAVS